MRSRMTQKGFAHLALVLLLAVVVVVAVAGYKVVKDRQDKAEANKTSSSLVQSDDAQAIQSAADLDTATDQLNNQAVDSDLNPDQLNDDVSSLL